MAFCSHCGKNVTEQATKCLACGKELQAAKPAGGKFKGTMMMQAPAPPPAAAAPAAAAQPPAAAAPPPAAAAPPPAAAAPPPAAEAPKMTLKGTMIGGIAAPAPAAPAQPAAQPLPQPAAGAISGSDSSAQDGTEDGHGRFLVGDPMAPPEVTPASTPLERPQVVPAYSPRVAPPAATNGRMLMVAIAAMLVMAAVATAVARQMGLF